MNAERGTSEHTLFDLREAVGDVVFEGRVEGYDPIDGASIDDPTGSLGRLRVALAEADRLLDSQRKTAVPHGGALIAQGGSDEAD